MDFTNKTAISTGAASGMGLLFAQNWAALGGNVLTRAAMANMKTLLGRAGQPRKIIDLCLFLASEKGQFINGENIMIDGGRNAMGRWI